MLPFITFEGLDGSGKTTQINRLSAFLEQKKISHIKTREPGGSDFSEALRSLLLSQEAEKITPEAQAMLMCAARREHLQKTIQPARSSGRWVLCDRFMDSTTVYQGFVQGMDLEQINQLHIITLGSLLPTLTFVLVLEPELARERALREDKNHFDARPLSFFTCVAKGFKSLIKAYPERLVPIPADQEPVQVTDLITAKLEEKGFL